MKKRILSMLLSIVMVVSLLPGFTMTASAADITSSQPAVGDGSEGNPYQITSAGELYWFAEYVNAGNASACAKLMKDITINENVIVNGTLNSDTSNFVAWTPIGVRNGSSTKAFSGIFDGGDHTISGLYVSATSGYQGLFGYIQSATVKNVKVADSYFSGTTNIGAIVGCYGVNGTASTVTNCHNVGSVVIGSDYYVGGVVGGQYAPASYVAEIVISNCSNSGSVTGAKHYVGGVIAYARSTSEGTAISNCTNTGTVTNTSTSDAQSIGGIAGYFSGTGKIVNCTNSGKVSADSGEQNYVGGIVGYNYSAEISESKNSGTISGYQYVGGIVGSSGGTVSKCSNTGSVSGTKAGIGGIAGRNSGTVTDCTNSGSVQGGRYIGGSVDDGRYIGGIVGSGAGVSGCTNTGNITSNSYGVGGVIGYIGAAGTVTDCHNEGTVKGTYYIGGVVGYHYTGAVTYTKCSNKGNVEGSAQNVGGLFGRISSGSTVSECYNEGAVTCTGTYDTKDNYGVGGLAGATYNAVRFEDCYNAGSVNGGSNSYVGGLVGFFHYASGSTENYIKRSHNTGSVIGGNYVGGLFGTYESNGVSEECYNTGSVNGNNNVGGLVGYRDYTGSSEKIIKNCYNTGSVSGTSYVGGLFGYSYYKNCLETSYNVGTVSGTSNFGGIIGNNKSVINCYYLDTCVTNGNTRTGATALTAQQMTDDTNWQTNFAGFDTTTPVWSKQNNEGTRKYLPKLDSYSPTLHIHSWTYNGNGNTITATCNVDGCSSPNGGSVTLSAPADLSYSNSSKDAVCTYNDWEPAALNVVYNEVDRVNVTGQDIVASITAGEATASVNYTIMPLNIATSTVTISPSAPSYDGNEKTVTVTVKYGSTALAVGTDYEVTGITSATEIGTYTVTITGKGNCTGTVEKTWTISKGSLSSEIEIEGWTYLDDPKEPSVTNNPENGEVTYTYYTSTGRRPIMTGTENGTETAGGVPKYAGTYYVGANIAETEHYKQKTISPNANTEFVISPREVTEPTFEGLQVTYPYDNGNEIKPAFTLKDDLGNVIPESEYTVTYGDNTDEGEATITITDNADGNYNVSGTARFTIAIATHSHEWTYELDGTYTIKATCTADGCTDTNGGNVIIAAPASLDYTGNAIEAVVTNNLVDKTVAVNVVYTAASGSALTEGKPVKVGLYTASITLGGVTASVEFEITAATPSIAWKNTTESVAYTGSAVVITAPLVTLVNGETYSGTISYSYTGTSVGNGLPINAGTYEITASIPAQGNYAAATTTNKLTLTITKAAAPTIAWPTASSLVYGQKLSASVLSSNDANGTFAWEDENTVPTVANNGYVVVYTPWDTDNYDYTGVVLEKTIAVTVTAADQADFSISGKTTATYGDAPITLTAAGGSGTGTITWEITSGNQFASIDQNGVVTIKGAGTVTVKATKAADGNYKEKVDTHEITISKATVSADNFSYSAPSDLVYNKTEKAATVTGNNAYGAISIKYYSDSSLTTVVSPINVGTYYVGITTAGGDNYEAVTTAIGVGNFEITARPVTVTADAKTMQYGDNVPELTYTHNLIEGDSFTGSLATTATKTSDVGEYDITKGDLANSNYTISFNGAKLTITKANGPAAPTVTGSYTSDDMTYTYTVDAITGAEYSKDGTKWQDSNVFANLVAGQKYTFYARIKETKNVLAGAIGTSAEVDLSKLSGKGTVTISDWTYGKDAATPKIESTTGNAVESYLYESTDGKGYSSANAPTNVGEYKLTVTFAATTTHNGTTASDTFTIKKATPAVTAPSNLTATYGDTLASVQLPEGWAWKDAATTEVGTVDGTNEFTVIYTHPTDADNHEQVEKTVSIAVSPKAVTAIVTVVGENFIFNGSEQKPGVTVKDDDNTIPESEYTVSYKDNTNAGIATVTVTDKEGGNYTVTGETTFAIAKKASSALSGVEREFMRTIATTGNEIDVDTMLPDDHGIVTYTITSSGYTVLENVAVDANGKLVFDTKTSAAAASDTITVKVVMQNYTDVTLTVTVILNEKTPQEITGVTAAAGLIYNGEAQQGYTGIPASEKYTGAYEITYTGRSNTYNSSAAPTNAGDYTVTFKIPDSDLYYSGNVSVNFTIGKAQATVTADDKTAYVGDRMPSLTYAVEGLIGNDTISVELSCNANMNRAGETPIIVTATDPNGNYEITTVNGILTVKNYIYIPVVNPTYPPVVNDNANGDVTVSPKRPEQGDTVTIIPDPDKGYEVDAILVTDKNGRLVTLVDNGNGTYSFKQPNGKVTIDITFKEIVVVEEIDTVCPGDKTCPMYGFTDLDRSAWYHDGVHFCIENGLMNGVGKNEFQPNATTSRAMIVTILWRLAGEPVVNYLMQFDDVANDQWHTEAIRWAASEGIVNGYSAEKFGPNDTITREQLATILYRYEQKQGGGFTGAWMFRMDYVDLADVSEWAYEAMCWMNMNSIVNGLPDKVLDPKGSATRAQAATMLYRYCEVYDKED